MIRKRAAAALVAAGAAVLCAGPALAYDPAFDPSAPLTGPTAVSPSAGAQRILREAQHGPALPRQFGLPSVSGPIPSLLPPSPRTPVLGAPRDETPPVPPVYHALRPGQIDR
jgi:hypothetical protein